MTHAELHAVDVGRARPGGKVAERFPDQTPVDGTPVPTLAEVLSMAVVEGGPPTCASTSRPNCRPWPRTTPPTQRASPPR